ncbi:MAG TPA: lytic murein transglycosylase [Gammaproteobacteria bacterium]|nr:lytic murein transglycosylase [Gammaproteobacteria bacterium]
MNQTIGKYTFILLCLFVGLFCSPSFSETLSRNSMSFESWIERLRDLAFSKGISTDTLENTFIRNRQMDLSTKQYPPATQFAPNAVHDHAVLSKLLIKQYADRLFEISHLFGVDTEVIAAITSMQNNLTKGFPAIDILINRSFANPKNLDLQNELIQALRIVDEGQISVQKLTSDGLGRLGRTAFKPSVFRDYAIDYDNDGQYDLWQNYADIFASTANYLNSIGWQAGADWGFPVIIPEAFDMAQISLFQQQSLKAWQALGVVKADGDELPLSKELGALTTLDGQYYLVLNNYFALLRWNRSPAYAYSIGQIIDLLRPKPVPASDTSFDEEKLTTPITTLNLDPA